MVLDSKTRARVILNPAPLSNRRAERASGTASLISVSCVPLLMPPESFLLGLAALVMIQKVLVDWFAAAEPLLHAVPEVNAAFAKFPAEINFRSAKQRREVHQ